MSGEARLWCDRLVRGLGQHEFDIYALSRSERQEVQGWIELPPQVNRVRTAPLWTVDRADDGASFGAGYGRRARRRFAECFGELAAAVCDSGTGSAGSASGDPEALADRFGSALYGLAELAGDQGGLVGALRSETAVRALEGACRAPGALRAARTARVPDLLAVAGLLERALRPLSLDWYGADGLGAVDLCHATSGGPAALPGLLAQHFSGVPLLVTEYGVQLRAHYLATGDEALGAPARALLASFHGKLAAEVYRRATVITPGNTHARRWQERCGAERSKLRTVYPGMEASRFAEVGEREDPGDPDTLVWVGRIEPAKDLISLLHAFAEIRREEPKARLRIVGAPAEGPDAAAYLAHCRALAAPALPRRGGRTRTPSATTRSPSRRSAGPRCPTSPTRTPRGRRRALQRRRGLPDQPGRGHVLRARHGLHGCRRGRRGHRRHRTGGARRAIRGRSPTRASRCCATRSAATRLGAAARARALELFTVEQNIAAFRGIYLEIVSHCPVRREALDDAAASRCPSAIRRRRTCRAAGGRRRRHPPARPRAAGGRLGCALRRRAQTAPRIAARGGRWPSGRGAPARAGGRAGRPSGGLVSRVPGRPGGRDA